MKTEFQYSRTYEFLCATGKRHHYFFNLVDRYGGQASFSLTDIGVENVISGPVEMDGDIETANFFTMAKNLLYGPTAGILKVTP